MIANSQEMKSSLLYLLSIFCLANSAPSTKPKALYDQKQNGEHNIQVHLNDIQIVALLGEDALGVSIFLLQFQNY